LSAGDRPREQDKRLGPGRRVAAHRTCRRRWPAVALVFSPLIRLPVFGPQPSGPRAISALALIPVRVLPVPTP
jgi:hypothetical protein